MSRRVGRIPCPQARFACEYSSASAAAAAGGSSPDGEQPAAAPTGVWPIPLAAGPAASTGSRRRDSARRVDAAIETITRLLALVLNWLAFGRPRGLPQTVSASRQRSPAQEAVWTRLRRWATLWARTSGLSDSLKRHLDKFSAIADLVSEMAAAALTLEGELLPYGRARRSEASPSSSSSSPVASPAGQAASPRAMQKPAAGPPRTMQTPAAGLPRAMQRPAAGPPRAMRRPAAGPPRAMQRPAAGPDPLPELSLTLQPTCAVLVDLARIAHRLPPTFLAVRFISDPALKAGFLDPALLVIPHADAPRRPPAVMCSRSDLLQLMRGWDSVGRLHIALAADVAAHLREGFFAVAKDARRQRQILNPRGWSSVSFAINDAAKDIGSAAALCGLYFPPGHVLVMASDDLEDFFHMLSVTTAQALRNAIRGTFRGEDFVGCPAFKESLRGHPVVGCLNTLAMGGTLALELAQHAHRTLLERAGCYPARHRVTYGAPLLHGPIFELLAIEGHVGIVCVPATAPCLTDGSVPPGLESFDQAAAAYSQGSLARASDKEQRGVTHAVAAGGEIDGVLGIISAPRMRTLALAQLTFDMLLTGCATRGLLLTLIGCWIYVLM